MQQVYYIPAVEEGSVETVEKPSQPLIFLLFGLWINCGTERGFIHMPVEKFPLSVIFAAKRVDSCLMMMNTLYIFAEKAPSGRLDACQNRRASGEYPQTHRLWINLPVDEEMRQNSRFFRAGKIFSPACPHDFISMPAL